MGLIGDWYVLAMGDVVSEVRREAESHLLNEFGIHVVDITDDCLKVQVMQNLDRRTGSCRILVRRDALDAR